MNSFDKEKNKYKEEMFQSIGEYLKGKRIGAGITQLEVAKELGNYASSQFISNIERGVAFPPMKVLRGMVKMYDIPHHEFLEFLLQEKRRYYKQTLFADLAKPAKRVRRKKA